MVQYKLSFFGRKASAKFIIVELFGSAVAGPPLRPFEGGDNTYQPKRIQKRTVEINFEQFMSVTDEYPVSAKPEGEKIQVSSKYLSFFFLKIQF